MEEGEPIEHRLVTRAIATAQKRVETHNFEIRKHLLEYDDVMNKQREVIYGMRRQILDGESQADTVAEWIEDLDRRHPRRLRRRPTATRRTGTWSASARRCTGSSTCASRAAQLRGGRHPRGAGRAGGDGGASARYAERERELGADLLRALERHEMLIVIDTAVEGPPAVDRSPQGRHRAARLRPARSADGVQERGVRPVPGHDRAGQGHGGGAPLQDADRARRAHGAAGDDGLGPHAGVARRGWPGSERAAGAAPVVAAPRPVPRTPTGQKIGRNDPCYCGSGKKYKKCHLLQQG